MTYCRVAFDISRSEYYFIIGGRRGEETGLYRKERSEVGRRKKQYDVPLGADESEVQPARNYCML